MRNNQVTANQGSDGVAVTGNQNTLSSNQVTANLGPGVQVSGSRNLVRNNQVHGNDAGIVVTGQLNRILDNDAADNLPPPGQFAAGDLDDENFNFQTFDFTCDQNTWNGNIWGSGGFFPDCTATGGHPAPGGPPAPSAAVHGAAGPKRPPPPPPSTAKAPSLDDTLKRGFPARP